MVMSLIESLTRIKNAVYGREVREAIHDGVFRANQIADGADAKADNTQIRQDAVEDFNNQVIQEMTDRDVISAPEIIQARGGKATLGARLDDTTAQLAQTGISVKTFGAVGDGVTDDSQAFQEGLDYISSDSAITKILFVPAGDYLINNELFVDGRSIEIVGVGDASTLLAGSNITRALMYSSREERTAVPTLLDVKIHKLRIHGQGRNADGILFLGFNRGCEITNCRVEGFRGTQINILGSWCFELISNVIRGFRYQNALGEWIHTGRGISFGDDKSIDFETSIVTVNIPILENNSIQFVNRGLVWRYGIGGSITGNTFENSNFTHLQMLHSKGVSVTGNYFEACLGDHSVMLGHTDSEETNLKAEMSGVFEGNKFSSRSGSADILVQTVKNLSVKFNDFAQGSRGNNIIISQNLIKERAYGNEIYADKILGINNINLDTNKVETLLSKNSVGTLQIVEGEHGTAYKYPDGTLIVKGESLEITAGSTSYFKYPVRFIEETTPIVTGLMDSEAYSLYSRGGVVDFSVIARLGTPGDLHKFSYIAIGRWKE